MNVGEMLTEDIERINKIHETAGYDYRLPDFIDSPLFPVRRSVYSCGQFMAAALVKLNAEVYLFVDHNCGTPQERKEGLEALHRNLITSLGRLGLDQMYCVLPPEVEKSFGKRLEEAGWVKDRGWQKYTFEIP